MWREYIDCSISCATLPQTASVTKTFVSATHSLSLARNLIFVKSVVLRFDTLAGELLASVLSVTLLRRFMSSSTLANLWLSEWLWYGVWYLRFSAETLCRFPYPVDNWVRASSASAVNFFFFPRTLLWRFSPEACWRTSSKLFTPESSFGLPDDAWVPVRDLCSRPPSDVIGQSWKKEKV